jgi:hypothetical protein
MRKSGFESVLNLFEWFFLSALSLSYPNICPKWEGGIDKRNYVMTQLPQSESW